MLHSMLLMVTEPAANPVIVIVRVVRIVVIVAIIITIPINEYIAICGSYGHATARRAPAPSTRCASPSRRPANLAFCIPIEA